MKKLLLMLLLSFNFMNANINDDTTHLQISKISIDNEQAIIKAVYSGFIDGSFNKILMYYNLTVDFYYKTNEKLKREAINGTTATYYLNELAKAIPYGFFKVLTGPNPNKEEVILVSCYLKDTDKNATFNVFFVLDKKESIKSILIDLK